MDFEQIANGLLNDYPCGTLEIRDRIVEALKQVAEVPGQWFCPKCNFALTTSILCAQTGQVGVNPAQPEPCPNDRETMQPMTWERHAKEMEKVCERMIEEKDQPDPFSRLREWPWELDLDVQGEES